MMDEAERAYDGGLMAMAEGGMPVDDRYNNQQDEDQEEKVEDQMLYASRMPSLMNR
jgi:phosphosulfolactate synthase (CoM biosynthesis protein A)